MSNRLSGLIDIVDVEEFQQVKSFGPASVTPALADAVRSLDEVSELEPLVRRILADHTSTPHGPAEITDILTHRLRLNGKPTLAAFILKGKAFQTVRPKDVAHQIYRLEKISGLGYAVFVAVGNVLDGAKEHFVSTAERLGIPYSIFDTTDIARMCVAFGLLCPRDARRPKGNTCECGYTSERAVLNPLQEEALAELKAAHDLGQSRGLVVLPTAAGKTRVAALDCFSQDAQCVAYVAHTHEILDPAHAEFSSVFGADQVHFIRDPAKLDEKKRISLLTIQFVSNNIELILKICSTTLLSMSFITQRQKRTKPFLLQ
jgi:Type III restriction enzyme, res subunit